MAPAIMIPAMGGTQGTLPGTLRRPGGRGLQGRAGHGLLAAVDHFQVPDIPPPQLPAHHPGQGTAPGEAQVRDLQAAGVQLVPGTQGGEDGDAPVPGPADEVNLAGDQVNGVGDVVQAVKKAVRRLPVVVDGQGVDGAVRIDIPDPLRHDRRLAAARRGGEGPQLAVDVAEAVGVPVHQGQLPHAGAGQGLGGAAPHAAEAHHTHMGAFQLLHGPGAKEHFVSDKSFGHDSTAFWFLGRWDVGLRPSPPGLRPGPSRGFAPAPHRL